MVIYYDRCYYYYDLGPDLHGADAGQHPGHEPDGRATPTIIMILIITIIRRRRTRTYYCCNIAIIVM